MIRLFQTGVVGLSDPGWAGQIVDIEKVLVTGTKNVVGFKLVMKDINNFKDYIPLMSSEEITIPINREYYPYGVLRDGVDMVEQWLEQEEDKDTVLYGDILGRVDLDYNKYRLEISRLQMHIERLMIKLNSTDAENLELVSGIFEKEGKAFKHFGDTAEIIEKATHAFGVRSGYKKPKKGKNKDDFDEADDDETDEEENENTLKTKLFNKG